MNTIETLDPTPFKHLIMTVGELPASYLESMTYYEMLAWICNYVEKNVVPTVNNNAEAIKEIQEWISTLDLQDEVDHKLDEMAESGELASIIAEYLNAKAVLGFDNVSSMKLSTTIVDGSVLETYGYSEKGDGGNAKYIARQVTNEDTVDEMTLIALADEDLVAEFIPENSTIYTKQFGIVGDGETDETNKLQKFFSVNADKYVLNSGNILVDDDIDIPSNSIVEFCEGCKLTRKTTDDNTYFMLNLVKVHDVVIENATLIGDRDTHTGASGEWGYGIHIAASQNITVKNANISKTWGDGIYVGYSYTASDQSTTKNILIDSCNIISCSRNGVAVCGGEDIVVRDCYIYGTNRTNPKSGIDIEAEGPDGINSYLKNVSIENNTTEANGESGICLNIGEDKGINITIDGHKSYSEKYGFVSYGISGGNTVKYSNGYIVKCNDAGLIVTKSQEGSQFIIQNVVVDSSTKSDSEHGLNGALVIDNTSYSGGDLIVDNLQHIKTYSSLYEFADLICVRTTVGTTQFLNLVLKNIYTKKYLCVPEAYNTKIENSIFEHNYTASVTLNYNNNTNKIIIDEQFAEGTIVTLHNSLADGEYEVIMLNNDLERALSVDLSNFTKVYDTTDGDVTSSPNCASSATCGYIRFRKTGNSIAYIQRNGFSL